MCNNTTEPLKGAVERKQAMLVHWVGHLHEGHE